MFKLESVKVLHLEPTTDCNAACPQCPRTYGTFTSAELSLNKIKELFSSDFIKQLDKMFMCGNLGDPAAAKESLEIFKYFRTVNPNITLGMNTNGGLRSPSWWAELAKVLDNPADYVVFSIDGLEDTNHIYRRNVIWSRIIENVKSFIDNGGSAHWDMLVFAHNEHQVNLAEMLAKDLGFSWFRAKVSKRHKQLPVVGINPPKTWQDPVVDSKDIDCYALKENSIYVDAQGNFSPCCWHGLEPNTNNVVEVFRKLEDSWTKTPHVICQTVCGTNELGTSFSNQWQRSVELR